MRSFFFKVKAKRILSATGKTGLKIGFISAVFDYTLCSLERTRNRFDLVNPLLSGAVLGIAVSVPALWRSRFSKDQLQGTLFTCFVTSLVTMTMYHYKII